MSDFSTLKPSGFTTFSRSPGVKFIIIGILSFLLLIPTLMVWVIVEERKSTGNSVERDIARSWGYQQQINGPFLAIPFTLSEEVSEKGEKRTRSVRRHAFFSAQKLDVSSNVAVEERKKSIYSLPVYRSTMTLKGNFKAPDLDQLRARADEVLTDEAFVLLNVSDVRAIKNDVTLKRESGPDIEFQPSIPVTLQRRSVSTYASSNTKGIHAPLSAIDLAKPMDFEIKLVVNGSKKFMVSPAGRTTAINMKSDWPHPSFTGAFLPEERTISQTGFKATWTIPNLARGFPDVVLGNRVPLPGGYLGVSLVKPLDFYQLTARALKYGIGLISLVFLAVFVLELKGKRAVHWIQYLLVGLALVIFYILLLAFAEQVGFDIAYGGAAVATVLLIGAYVASVTRNVKTGSALGFVLALVYGIFYLTLRENDYALVIGAVVAFFTIAATMFATRNVDWSGGNAVPSGQKEEAAE